jgi:imidazole glycerol phosphate synthase glutamine amidotransferase subunit
LLADCYRGLWRWQFEFGKKGVRLSGCGRSRNLTARKRGRAEKIVLPGVGHFSALAALDNMGLREAVLRSARAGKPLLGICLGMQWLFEGSDEAPECAGAGIFAGRCRQFPSSVKSPHVGWNSLAVRPGSRLLRGVAPESYVYFTHSFQAPVLAATTAASEYGTDHFPPSSNRETFSECSSIRRNLGTWDFSCLRISVR